MTAYSDAATPVFVKVAAGPVDIWGVTLSQVASINSATWLGRFVMEPGDRFHVLPQLFPVLSAAVDFSATGYEFTGSGVATGQ